MAAKSRRYERQTILSEIGPEGQARLAQASVLCVGAGGLGSPVALYLAAAGVGRVGIIDPDRVDETNLQRQVLFGTSQLGLPKAQAAADRLRDLNPEIEIIVHAEALTAANALERMRGYDVVIDGTDNFSAKLLINAAAARLGIPVVYGTILRFEGRASVFWRGHGPCYRCLHPDTPRAAVASCAEAGVIGGVAGIVGSIQATEAVKLVLFGTSHPERTLLGRLLIVDALTMAIDQFAVARDPSCPVCSRSPEEIELTDLVLQCSPDLEAAPDELTGCVLIDVREEDEWETGRIESAIHWPLSRLESGEFPELDPSDRCVLYCQAGSRSLRALELFRARGIAARHLARGIAAWRGRLISDPSEPRT